MNLKKKMFVGGLLLASACAGSPESTIDQAGVPFVQVDPAGAVVRSDVGEDDVITRVEVNGSIVDFSEVEPGEIIVTSEFPRGRQSPLAGQPDGTAPLDLFRALTTARVPAALAEAAAREPVVDEAEEDRVARSCSSPQLLERNGHENFTSPCFRTHGGTLTASAGGGDFGQGEVRYRVRRKTVGGHKTMKEKRVSSLDSGVEIRFGGAHLARRAYHIAIDEVDEGEAWSFSCNWAAF
jgi:hypothetical protein